MPLQRNILAYGDCLDFIERYRNQLQERLQTIYIDPPFFSGSEYTMQTRSMGAPESAPSLKEKTTYIDKWEGGLKKYLEFMEAALEAMISLLKPSGCLWVHLDWHVSHYIKTILDSILGYGNFVNEIIWRRTNSPKVQSKGFGAQHDTILLYAKKPEQFIVKQPYRKHDERTLRPYRYKDERGRFRLIEIEAQGIQRTEGRKQFEWQGRTAPYLYNKQTLDEWWKEGLIYTSKNKRYSKKQYISDVPGVPVSDLWMDISPLQGSSVEYRGFLTQKPLALIRRIIESTSSPGEVIADFFVGSGTSIVAAEGLARKWVACDASDVAIDLCKQRLAEEAVDQRPNYEFIRV